MIWIDVMLRLLLMQNVGGGMCGDMMKNKAVWLVGAHCPGANSGSIW